MYRLAMRKFRARWWVDDPQAKFQKAIDTMWEKYPDASVGISVRVKTRVEDLAAGERQCSWGVFIDAEGNITQRATRLPN